MAIATLVTTDIAAPRSSATFPGSSSLTSSTTHLTQGTCFSLDGVVELINVLN